MLGSKYDISMQQGSNYDLSLTIKDSLGNPVDITGCSARMQIRSAYSSSSIAADLTEDNGLIILNGPSGKINISLSAANTAAIKVDLAGKGKPPSTAYVYDLEFIDTNNKVSKLIYGDVTVYGEVTR